MTRSKISIGVIIILLFSTFMVMRARSIQPITNNSTMNTLTRQQPSLLTEKLEMGVVELHVKDMTRMRRFYEELVGLMLISETDDAVTLGANPNLIIRLVSAPTLSNPPAGSAGLYHTATVFESRSTLAETLERILKVQPGLYQGSADHLVSEAFYFADPEGNGVELYFDKDPSTWQWKDGNVVMDSLYIDVNSYIKQHAVTSASPMPTALFVSDGQYHHHLGR
jgi:catechol 2,3-dioxygenase